METNESIKSVKTYTTEEKRDLVERWKQSGLSMMAFSKQHGINYHTFVWWIKPKKNKAKSKVKPAVSTAGFSEIKMTTNRDAQLFARLTVGKVQIELFQPLHADYLKQLSGL
ncbi:MAG TPA: transposase [Paludibacter sp.]|jgi:transposase-like protein|nr:transposase [Paludibacter sp.]